MLRSVTTPGHFQSLGPQTNCTSILEYWFCPLTLSMELGNTLSVETRKQVRQQKIHIHGLPSGNLLTKGGTGTLKEIRNSSTLSQSHIQRRASTKSSVLVMLAIINTLLNSSIKSVGSKSPKI